jgi:chemotaxis protein methyltransferase CheR
VVFCRNVLMYFDAGARKKVVDAFHEKLVPGGHLLLGHSESLINLSTAFELLHLRNDMV